MTRGKASGITLWKHDARVVLGMVARGDRDHDIAAWFGVNQGRIAEVKNGEFGDLQAEPVASLPPSGSPGLKGRKIRGALTLALQALEGGDASKAATILADAGSKYDANEV
jgi:hypothetical protein